MFVQKCEIVILVAAECRSNDICSKFTFGCSFNEIIDRKEIRPFFGGADLSFFQISIIAQNKNEAAEKGLKIFDLFRSIVNLSFRCRTRTHQYGKLESLSLIRKPPFLFIFDMHNKCISENLDHIPIFNGIIQTEINLAKSLDSKRELVDHIISQINTGPTDLADLICDLIMLLSNALDNYYEPKECALNLWLIFEIASMKEERESHSIIPFRIASLWTDTSINEGILHNFRNERNSYIHRGESDQFSTTHNDIYRGIAEELILYLINNLHEISTLEGLKSRYPPNQVEPLSLKQLIFMKVSKFFRYFHGKCKKFKMVTV